MFISMDFGTSFSQIATINFDSPILLHPPNDYGTPTSFYYDSINGVLIGTEALNAGQGEKTANLLNNFKLNLKNSFTADGRTFESKEIVAEIYKALLHKANRIASVKGINPSVEGAVLTVPVKFGIQERTLLKNAAEMASNSSCVTAILDEPVAAAIYYFHKTLNTERTILVYDMGGGTCDVAIVKTAKNSPEYFEVIDADNVEIGGKDFDEVLSRHILEALKTDYRIDCENNVAVKEKIRRAAIDVKINLSNGFYDTYTARIEINGTLCNVKIPINVFEEITSDLMDETLDCLENLYNKNSAKYKIDEIICVGGSSNMPQVKNKIEKRFPNTKVSVHYPENSVVFGAAIFSNIIQGKKDKTPLHLSNKTAFSYGLRCEKTETKEKFISNLIKKESNLPAECTKNFFAANAKGKDTVTVDYNIYESQMVDNEFDFIEDKLRHVGVLTVTHKAKNKGRVNMKVSFKLTTDELLEVKVVDENNKEMSSTFTISPL